MATQTKTQAPMGQTQGQHRPSEPAQPQRRPQVLMSHGQGQVKNPESDRRLKQNRG